MPAGLVAGEDLDAPRLVPFLGGEVALYTIRRPGREGPNQDGALHVELQADRGVLAVADGAGGEPAGARAAGAALGALLGQLDRQDDTGQRESILSGLDEANRSVIAMGVGARTTLALVSIVGGSVRSYHVGDSFVLVVGQRGKRKLETISHSPVGYAVEAGLLDETDALTHDDLHLVSNMVGDAEMRVEMSALLKLAPRDTVVVGSDGVSDNLSIDEVVELVRKGPLRRAALRLARAVEERMRKTDDDAPGKPDDVTFLLFRAG